MSEPLLPHPSSWEVTTLEPNKSAGFISRVESGGTPRTTVDDLWDGDIPWLTPKEITRGRNGIYVSNTERNITEKGLSTSSAKLMPAGTVMLSKRAPVGAVAIAAVPMATNQGFLNFVCGQKLLPAYFAYWLIANEEYLNAVANGSTYPELYKGDLFEFEMAVPPIPAQRKILSLITSTQKLASLLDVVASSSTSADDVLRLQELGGKINRVFKGILPMLLSGKIIEYKENKYELM